MEGTGDIPASAGAQGSPVSIPDGAGIMDRQMITIKPPFYFIAVFLLDVVLLITGTLRYANGAGREDPSNIGKRNPL
jgi:hypothetical protein